MIGRVALHELGIELRDGDWWQELQVADQLLDDPPMFEVIRARVVDDVVRGAGVGRTTVRSFAFSSAYLRGVWQRQQTPIDLFTRGGPPRGMGVVCALGTPRGRR